MVHSHEAVNGRRSAARKTSRPHDRDQTFMLRRTFINWVISVYPLQK
jgi:hypothetical protein